MMMAKTAAPLELSLGALQQRAAVGWLLRVAAERSNGRYAARKEICAASVPLQADRLPAAIQASMYL